MADSFIQVPPDSTGKKTRTASNPGSGTEDEYVRIALADDGAAGGTSGNPIRIDPTGVTAQPVSGTVAASNLAQWMGSAAPTVGQKTKSASLPVTIASDQGNTGTVDEIDRATRLLGRLNGTLSSGNSSTTLLTSGQVF